MVNKERRKWVEKKLIVYFMMIMGRWRGGKEEKWSKIEGQKWRESFGSKYWGGRLDLDINPWGS